MNLTHATSENPEERVLKLRRMAVGMWAGSCWRRPGVSEEHLLLMLPSERKVLGGALLQARVSASPSEQRIRTLHPRPQPQREDREIKRLRSSFK